MNDVDLSEEHLDVYDRGSGPWNPDHGEVDIPSDWDFLPTGDAFVTRTVKAAGSYWLAWRPRSRNRPHRRLEGLWAPAETIAAARRSAAETDAKRAAVRDDLGSISGARRGEVPAGDGSRRSSTTSSSRRSTPSWRRPSLGGRGPGGRRRKWTGRPYAHHPARLSAPPWPRAPTFVTTTPTTRRASRISSWPSTTRRSTAGSNGTPRPRSTTSSSNIDLHDRGRRGGRV